MLLNSGVIDNKFDSSRYEKFKQNLGSLISKTEFLGSSNN